MLWRVGRTGLLTIAERRIGDPDFLGGRRRHLAVLKQNPGDFGVGKLLAQQVRLLDVNQLVAKLLLDKRGKS